MGRISQTSEARGLGMVSNASKLNFTSIMSLLETQKIGTSFLGHTGLILHLWPKNEVPKGSKTIFWVSKRLILDVKFNLEAFETIPRPLASLV